MTAKTTKKKFELPNKTIMVKPNVNNPGWIKDPRHQAFFLVEGATKRYMVPVKKDGGLVNVLTDEEKDFLEKALHMESNGLSIYKKPDDNFWTQSEAIVEIGKDPLILDLSNPLQYIKWKILLANKDHIAPSVRNIKDKRTYKYYIEDKEDLNKIKTEEAQLNTKVWTAFGKISQSKKSLLDMMYAYSVLGRRFEKYAKLNEDSALDFLQGQLADIISSDVEMFLELIDDPLLDTRVLVGKSIQNNSLERKGEKYYITGDPTPIGNNLKETCEYLNSDRNQDLRLTLENKLND